MASIDYETIFNSFLGNIVDYDLAQLDEDLANTLMKEYLRKAISQAYNYHIFSFITFDGDLETVSYEMEYPVNDFIDNEFVIYILSKAMVLEWITPQVNNTVNLAQMFTGKESKYYSQAAHLDQLRNLKSDIEVEIRRKIKDRGYVNNSYLGG